ncbi:nicotinate-nucleotide adenylyltransferase [Ectothiorhodospiraceae bacterium BW-2]|nr:nicotinate-nucleotide adenylyltransferase [Ectothiorhodospiraceae bacterium BW-2]
MVGEVIEGRIALFGGTFNPIHYGHLRVAEEVAEQLRLERVEFLPAALPPLRDRPEVAPSLRLKMVELALQQNRRFRLNPIEQQRCGTSYTVDTLLEWQRQREGQPMPFWLMGADAFVKLHCWSRWRQLLTLCRLVVMTRPGYPLRDETLAEPLQPLWQRRVGVAELDSATAALAEVVEVAVTPLEISASAIRQQLARGGSIRYLTPDSVIQLIEQHGCYAAKEIEQIEEYAE